jgi:hypothetical protein
MGNCFAQGEAEGERGLAFDKASRFSQIALPFSQRAMWMGVLFDCYPVTPGVIIPNKNRESGASPNSLEGSRRFPWITLIPCRLKGGDPAMNTQTSKSGFANNLWLQLAALVVVVAVLVAIAAAYVW